MNGARPLIHSRFFAGLALLLGPALAAVPAGAVSILLITPEAGAGRASAAADLSERLLEALRQHPGMMVGTFDPASPLVKLAIRRRSLVASEVRTPNDFTSALHLAKTYGADFVVFGALQPGQANAPGLPASTQLVISLGSVETSNITLVPIPIEVPPPAPGDRSHPDTMTLVAREIADRIARRILSTLEAVKSNPGEGHWLEAQRLLAAGEKDDALVEFKAAIAAEPDNGPYRAALAKLLVDRGDLARAVTLFQDAATSAPFDVEIRVGLGQALESRGDTTGALAAYREAVKLAPDRPASHIALGRLLLRSGDPAGAAAELERVSQADDPSAIEDLAEALSASGKADRARTLLEDVIRTNPTLPHPRERLAALQLQTGQGPRAIQTLSDALRAGAIPGVQGLLVASNAIDSELTGAISSLPTMAAGDLEALRVRVQAAADLSDLLISRRLNAAPLRRRSAAASDILQAIAELQHPTNGKPPEGDVTVLLAQARQLLRLK